MMRNEIDLSQHRPSRVSRVVIIVSTLGVAVIAAWVFAPILLANYTAATATLSAGPKPRPIAQDQAPRVAAAQAAAPAAITTAAASADEQAPPPAAAPTRLAGFDTNAAAPWPKNPPALPQDTPTMSISPAPPAPATDADSMRLASAAPTAASAETLDNVPLPRKRPSHLIAARLAIPLPRPRPDNIESDAPSPNQATFDLQVERMR
jgi:hypothetical protein